MYNIFKRIYISIVLTPKYKYPYISTHALITRTQYHLHDRNVCVSLFMFLKWPAYTASNLSEQITLMPVVFLIVCHRLCGITENKADLSLNSINRKHCQTYPANTSVTSFPLKGQSLMIPAHCPFSTCKPIMLHLKENQSLQLLRKIGVS